MPILDSPRRLQLHTSLDLFTFYPFSHSPRSSRQSAVFWLDRDITLATLPNLLTNEVGQEDACIKRIQDIKDEGWDLFLRVLGDGSMAITAVAVRVEVIRLSGLLKFVITEHR
jgi:hypothetical protein